MKTPARIALLLLALTTASCATGGLTPQSNPMPAARAGLPAPYRVFYDALADYGEWTLIEPYGYVFRPNVSFIGWEPYEYGYWAPNDTWGWVWISSEPFGWATYHYGTWMFDRYEGWVWLPGLDWGPAWVDWQEYGGYLGWSPLMSSDARPPDDAWHYVSASELPVTDLSSRLLTRNDVKTRSPEQVPHAIRNMTQVNGVDVNRGPSFDLIERQAGPLSRVRISEIATGPAVPKDAPASGGVTPLLQARERAAQAARDTKAVTEKGAPQPREVPLLRLIEKKRESGAEHRSPLPHKASPDSTKRKLGSVLRSGGVLGKAPADTTGH